MNTSNQNHPAENPEPLAAGMILSAAEEFAGAVRLIVAVLGFLAAVALAALAASLNAAEQWRHQLLSRATVHIHAMPERRLDADLNAALSILKTHKGIVAAQPLPDDYAKSLLKPWIGDDILRDELPLPKMIALDVNVENPPDFKRLENLLKDAAGSVEIDDHGVWKERLLAAAARVRWSAVVAILAVLVGVAALAAFAARAVADAEKDAVAILRIVGAPDRFVTLLMVGKIARIAFTGGALGAVAGGAAVLVAETVSAENDPQRSTYDIAILNLDALIGPSDYALLALIPVAAALAAVVAGGIALRAEKDRPFT